MKTLRSLKDDKWTGKDMLRVKSRTTSKEERKEEEKCDVH
jgi:hypothetical protein